VIVLWVVDAEAARRLLRAGGLRCPDCRGVLRGWAGARPRRVRLPGGVEETLRPDRSRCRGCRRTHVLLPAACVPRSGHGAEVVGRALLAKVDGAGHQRIGERLGVAVGTMRRWMRGARDGLRGLAAETVASIRDAGVWVADGRSPARSLEDELAEALHTLGLAARAVARPDPPPPAPPAPGTTGIDYLGLLAAKARQQLVEQLRVADPAGLAGAPPWQVANIVTGGRLLRARPG
jgi:transposase-like protein